MPDTVGPGSWWRFERTTWRNAPNFKIESRDEDHVADVRSKAANVHNQTKARVSKKQLKASVQAGSKQQLTGLADAKKAIVCHETLEVLSERLVGGTFQLVEGVKPNGKPLWKSVNGNYWIFSGVGGQWLVGGEEEHKADFQCDSGKIASRKRHIDTMPDCVGAGCWLRFDGQGWCDDASINVIFRSEDSLEKLIVVSALDMACMGEYELVADLSPNGMPLWQMPEANFYIFSCPRGRWFVGSENELNDGFQCSTGLLTMGVPHGGRFPESIGLGGWFLYDDGKWCESPTVDIVAAKVDAPAAVLDVLADKPVGGRFQLVEGVMPNAMPLWKSIDGLFLIFSGPGGQWLVGGEREQKLKFKRDSGFIASRDSHGGVMPDRVGLGRWLRFDGTEWRDDAKIDIISRLEGCPHTLKVLSGLDVGIDGEYKLVEDQSPNGMPLWKKPDANFWIFNSPQDEWFLGDEQEFAQGFKCDTGILSSRQPHLGKTPEKIALGGWLHFNDDQWSHAPTVNIVTT
eukprot:TRINITY_DN14192_c0_g1_i1.p1 TRINITY_DN14192_c0_g1~~TRINITY_DN14192_c0_g1_i1.p1  ORF type:complete len:590 (-),score=82.97 TRINITY_DN14192_c0_g1_i1:196-1740(-)